MIKNNILYERIGLATEKADILTDLPLNNSGTITGDSIMKRIPLTKGKYAIVDDEDYSELAKHKWYASGKGKYVYAIRDIRGKGEGNRKTIIMHRVILNAPDGMEVDHINGDRLDNRKKNLRICSHRENIRNQKKANSSTKTSKYKGVDYHRGHYRVGRWRVRIGYNYKQICIGMFRNEIEAAKAYDIEARTLFGEFANTNFKL